MTECQQKGHICHNLHTLRYKRKWKKNLDTIHDSQILYCFGAMTAIHWKCVVVWTDVYHCIHHVVYETNARFT